MLTEPVVTASLSSLLSSLIEAIIDVLAAVPRALLDFFFQVFDALTVLGLMDVV